MLSSDLEPPFVSETSIASNLEQSLDILSQLSFKDVGSHLQVLSLLVISLPVEEPSRHAVSFRIVDYISNGIALRFSELSCSESGVESEDLTDEESESTTNSLDLFQSKRNGSLSINVCIQNTMNMLEGILSVRNNQRHLCG